MTERLIHYTAQPFELEQRCVEQEDPQTFALKPVGLWVSVDDAWHVAALKMFGDDELQYASLVALASDANVLRLKTVREIDDFTEQYAIIADEHFDFLSRTIDWRRVAAEYQGIIIAPYQFERRLTQHTFWYYGWTVRAAAFGIQQQSLQSKRSLNQRLSTYALKLAHKLVVAHVSEAISLLRRWLIVARYTKSDAIKTIQFTERRNSACDIGNREVFAWYNFARCVALFESRVENEAKLFVEFDLLLVQLFQDRDCGLVHSQTVQTLRQLGLMFKALLVPLLAH